VQDAIDQIAPNDSMERYTELGVDCLVGSAEVLDGHRVLVRGEDGDKEITAKNIILATGAGPFVPGIPGLSDHQPLTSDNIWQLTTMPERLLVMGAGPIGCELAQSFQRLGAKVTLVDMEDRVLPREDPDVSEFVLERLRADGVDVLVSHKGESFENNTLTAKHNDKTVHVAFDRVLVAIGRRAHTEATATLDLTRTRAGTLEVDDYLRTSNKNIFACGDAVGPYQFTHMASHQAWYASVNALFGRFKKFKVNYSVVPWATYTDPEVARVGLNETDAKEQGITVEVTQYDLAHLDRAIADGTNQGFVKVLTKPKTDKILGATIVGPHAGELISEYVLAMTHGLGLKAIMGTIHIYPTLSEANKFAASAWRKNNAPTWLLPWVERLHRFMR